MYKEIAKLILYRDLGEDSILLKLSGIFRDFELGLAEKEELTSRIYEQMKAPRSFHPVWLRQKSVAQLSDLHPADQRKLFQHDQ